MIENEKFSHENRFEYDRKWWNSDGVDRAKKEKKKKEILCQISNLTCRISGIH